MSGASDTESGLGPEEAPRLDMGEFATEVLESIEHGYCVVDGDWRVVYANRSACAMLGAEPDNIIGEILWLRFPQFVGSAERQLRDAAATGRSVEEEVVSPISGIWLMQRVWPVRPGLTGIFWRDITTRKTTLEALHQSNNHLRLAIEATALGTWEIDVAAGRFIWSDRYRAMLGAEPEMPSGQQSFEALVDPDDLPGIVREQQRILDPASGGLYRVEFRTRQRSGGLPRWIVSTGRVTYDDAGKAIHIIGTSIDVTARRKVEESLRESENRLRRAHESGGISDWEWSPETGILHWSDSLYGLIGRTPDTFSLQGDSFLDVIHPEDRERVRAAVNRIVAGKQERFDIEFRVIWPDGSVHWLASRAEIDPNRAAGPLKLVGINFDVTARREAEEAIRRANEVLEERVHERTRELREANLRLAQQMAERERAEAVLTSSEERYRTLYNRTPMALHSVDDQARIIDVNDSWLHLLGYRRDEVLGRSPSDFMTEDSAQLYRENAWPDMLASEGNIRAFEYRMVKRSGEIFDARISSRGERDADGRFLRTWAATEDITVEKAAQAQLRRAQRIEAVGQLTSGVAHDFNNLLTSIIGNLEMLEQHYARDERSARWMAAAQKAAERGSRLTAQLLAFSRQQRLAPEPIDLNRVVTGMGSMLQSTIGATIRIETALAEILWPAFADPSQIELVILNLVINARDAIVGSGRITIATANATLGPPIRPEEPAPGDYVMVAVSDTGSGIPAAVLDKVFEPFFTTKDVGKGSGLGLPQVLGVAQQLNGGVRIVTGSGEGTSVCVYLPRASTAAAEPESPGARPGSASAAGGTPPACILLVDDDDDVRTITAAILSAAGHRVIEAGNGPAALERLMREGERVDLLVVDFAMPGMNGAEVARIARRDRPELPVLFITGFADSAVLAADASADEILSKPYRAPELELRIAKLLAAAGERRRADPARR